MVPGECGGGAVKDLRGLVEEGEGDEGPTRIAGGGS